MEGDDKLPWCTDPVPVEETYPSHREQLKIEENKGYLSNCYLGQDLDELLKGELRRPPSNFEFKSCHNRRKVFSMFNAPPSKRQRTGELGESKSKVTFD